MNAPSNAPSMPDALLNAKHATNATLRTRRFQDNQKNSRVGTASSPGDKPIFVPGNLAARDVWTASDDSFALFLATVSPDQLNDWERRVLVYHLTRKESVHA